MFPIGQLVVTAGVNNHVVLSLGQPNAFWWPHSLNSIMLWVNLQILHQFLSELVALGKVFLGGSYFASSILISPPESKLLDSNQEKKQICILKWIFNLVELREPRSSEDLGYHGGRSFRRSLFERPLLTFNPRSAASGDIDS